tara:strand:- start:698 stop:2239 length:1542 start_codon:yes stop_codon:yes gene_type:complete
MNNVITVNDCELIGNLVPAASLGVFSIVPKQGSVMTRIVPTFGLYKLIPDSKAHAGFIPTDEVIIALNDDYKLDLLRLSLMTVQSQIEVYQPNHFHDLIKSFSPDAIELHDRGSILMKNEADLMLKEICASLLKALDKSVGNFFSKYIETLDRLESGGDTFDAVKAAGDQAIIKASIEQFQGYDDSGPYLTSLLVAKWLKPIFKTLWHGQLIFRAAKYPIVQRNVNDLFLDLVHTRPVQIIPQQSTKVDRIWVDLEGSNLTAGLSSKVVETILDNHKNPVVIDLLKLFTSLWNEYPEIQRTRCYNFKNRWSEIALELNERYGVPFNGDSKQHIINSCRLLEALRWGTSWEDHSKLLAFGGRKRNEQLIVSYMEGFWQPLTDHERLIPVINHPSGKGRSRATYNRLGLAISSWLVHNSHAFYNSSGIGVKLDDEAYKYFKERVGYKRQSVIKTALKAFEKYGAITMDNGVLGLGPKNAEGTKLIMEGARASLKGWRGGIKSQRKKREKLKLEKK